MPPADVRAEVRGVVEAALADRNALAPAPTPTGMQLSGKRLLITGGLGLIGSHLAADLAADNEVVVADHSEEGWSDLPDGVEGVRAELADEDDVATVVTPDLDAVFHLAAWSHPNDDRPRRQFAENTGMTQALLDRMAEVDVTDIAFTSSSTVYGEAPRPTPEDYAPLEPISVYGASKLACEGLLSTYAHSHEFTVWNFRFANIVGPGQRGSVIPDFIQKLQADPGTLEILGNGRQEKSYLHVSECVEAIEYVVEHAEDAMNTYNLGTRTTTSVNRIADIVAEEMGLDPDYEYTGGDRGWTGDVPKMRLSIEKLAALGWEPDDASDDAVRRATRELVAELQA
jgi:UDP-glucose 4-epimerase